MLTIFFLGGAKSQSLTNTGYKAYSAGWKHATIWEKLILERISGHWPPRNISAGEVLPPKFFTQDLCPTLHHRGDEFVIEDYVNARVKATHSVGSVGKVKFVSFPNNYTGIFQGAKYGIVRMSHGGEPLPGLVDPTFGLALKFLRDGVDSASVVARTENFFQKSWNFFAENFSNHRAGSAVFGSSIVRHLAQASPHTTQVGLSDMARYGENGKYIPDHLINYPYQLVLKPTGKLSFPDKYHGDLEDDLITIDAETVLWDVFAWDNPIEVGGREEHIGSLILTSPLVRSLFGDTKLFFRHQDMREDFRLRPEWEEYTSSTPGVVSKCPVIKRR